jgi:hypothetical protein
MLDKGFGSISDLCNSTLFRFFSRCVFCFFIGGGVVGGKKILGELGCGLGEVASLRSGEFGGTCWLNDVP